MVYPTQDPLEEEYARPMFRRDKYTMLHWYYFPDSYDTWVTGQSDATHSVVGHLLSAVTVPLP